MAIVVGPTGWHSVRGWRLGTSCLIGYGFLICKAGGIGWIVSPCSTEVTRTWHFREDANTTAQAASGCTGWFVPTSSQLQNPGYLCRSFWGPSPCFTPASYWSCEGGGNNATAVNFAHAGNLFPGAAVNCSGFRSRAFRCVTY
jgi:hypothetical protein